jgi:hypothetical protein
MHPVARVGLFVILISVAAAPADTVTIGSAKDNTLYEDPDGQLSNGAGVRFFAGRTAIPEIRRGLIEFDIVAAVPPGATVNSVTLRLRMSRTIAGPQPVSLHRVLAEWGEGAANAPGEEGAGIQAEPGDATWLHTYYPDQYWATPGGDFAPEPSATTMVDQIGVYTWSSPQMVADVQAWLNQPDSNHGWMLRGNEIDIKTAKRFDTKETVIVNNRPALIIDFTPGGTACAGDADGDGDTDQSDLGLLLQHFGQEVPPGTGGDLNDDGVVNQSDLGILLGDFPCPA